MLMNPKAWTIDVLNCARCMSMEVAKKQDHYSLSRFLRFLGFSSPQMCGGEGTRVHSPGGRSMLLDLSRSFN